MKIKILIKYCNFTLDILHFHNSIPQRAIYSNIDLGIHISVTDFHLKGRRRWILLASVNGFLFLFWWFPCFILWKEIPVIAHSRWQGLLLSYNWGNYCWIHRTPIMSITPHVDMIKLIKGIKNVSQSINFLSIFPRLSTATGRNANALTSLLAMSSDQSFQNWNQ